MRARKKPWAEKELSTNELLIQSPSDYKGKWGLYFNNKNQLYVELGCGKGGFITKMAAARPDINFLAIEREKQIIVSGMRIAKSMGLKNIGFILGDAVSICEYLAEDDAQRLYINFCDPWPKKKWTKRRLTYDSYLNLYKRVLSGDGEIFLKTDSKGLFDFSTESFTKNGWLLTLNYENEGYDNIKTEYEEKFLALGLPIYRIKARIKRPQEGKQPF